MNDLGTDSGGASIQRIAKSTDATAPAVTVTDRNWLVRFQTDRSRQTNGLFPIEELAFSLLDTVDISAEALIPSLWLDGGTHFFCQPFLVTKIELEIGQAPVSSGHNSSFLMALECFVDYRKPRNVRL